MIEHHGDEEAYERFGPYFDAQYSGACAIDSDHPVKRGDRVSRVRLKANPFLVITGVGCKLCIKGMSRARE